MKKVDIADSQIQEDIVATLDQPVKSLYEESIPFIINEVSYAHQLNK